MSAQITITQLPTAGPITGVELVPIVQNGVTVQTTTGSIASGGSGTVTSVAVASANGFSGSVANPTTTPNITISTSVSGMLKGSGSGLVTATANTDYQSPITLTTTGSSGAATFDGSTLNIPQYTGGGGGSGTVTSVSVVSANGFQGSVATATTTPAITVSTNVTGILKGNGTAMSAAAAGTDYQAPITLTTTGTSGAATFVGNTLNIPQYSGGGGSGTVTSVAQSFTGGLISVAGSPITSSGTLALTVAGTSGGVPYFSSASTWASSAALTQYGIVYGGGAGAAPVSTAAGTTGQVLTATTGGAPTWANPATNGTVTSVAATVPSFLSVTGSPITTSGTLAIAYSGTALPLANGGTNATTASGARTSLGAAASGANTDITSVVLTTGTISTAPSSSTDIVNKSYADSIATGVNFHAACNLATTAALPTNTYNNGASGVGATLTAVANAALVVDSVTVTLNQRILVKNEVTGANNGIYTVTQVGSGALPYILTRATDYDTSGTGTNEIDQGDLVLVLAGAVNANTSWVQQTALPITVGTTALVFIQFAAVQTYTAGTGLTLSTNQFSITNVGTAGTYGSASTVPVLTTNAQGQVTSVTNTAIAIAGSAVSGNITGNAANVTGTVAFANGGTGLTATPTNGQIDIGNGSGFTRTTLTAGSNITITNGAGSITIAGNAGTVTSVAQSFTGGLISVGGSPVTSSGTLALTVAGTSGGIPYFSSASTWATSAALTANALMVGGGAGAAPSTVTTGTGVLTALAVNTGSSGAVVTQGGAIISATTVNDSAGTGYTIGYRQMPQNNQAAAATYTLVLADDGKHVYLTGGTTNTLTVPANSSVAFPIGTVITVVNNNSGSCTISGPASSLQLANGALAATRTLATKGMATMVKVGTDLWYVSGAGVT